MALSGDQKALLNLLASKGRSPDEIAGILGVDRSEVEDRLIAALGDLAPGGPALPPAVALQLVGRADPISRADAASALAADPELAERAERIRTALVDQFNSPEGSEARRETPSPASGGPSPETDASGEVEQGPSRKEAEPAAGRPGVPADVRSAEPGGHPPRRGFATMDKRLLSILVSAAGLIAVVAAVVLLFGGGDGDPDLDAGPTEARLTPVEGESGRGSVEFGFAGTNFAANVSFSGLEQNRNGESYALWLNGPVGAFPVERVRVGPDGSVAGQAVLNEAIICFIAADLFTDLRLARSGDGEFRNALRQAVRSNEGGPFPEYVGRTVLTGRITMPDDTRQTLVRECGGRTPEEGSRGS